jgi:hypothetical protein
MCFTYATEYCRENFQHLPPRWEVFSMSVDPEDVTEGFVKVTGAEFWVYATGKRKGQTCYTQLDRATVEAFIIPVKGA